MAKKMDPKLAALLKANPTRTPAEMTQVLYGKGKDIALQPQQRGSLVPFASIARRLNETPPKKK